VLVVLGLMLAHLFRVALLNAVVAVAVVAQRVAQAVQALAVQVALMA
jgi:hypothetical protein